MTPSPTAPHRAPLRVLFVRGGELNRFETQALPRLADHGVRVRAVADLRPVHEQRGLRVPVRRLPTPGNLLGSGRIRRAAAAAFGAHRLDHLIGLSRLARTADIVHGVETFFPLSEQAARLRERIPFRLVLTCWENIPFLHDDDPVLARRKRFVQARADLFLAVTPEAADALVAEGVDRARVTVIPPGIDGAAYATPGTDSRPIGGADLPGGERIVLYLGRLVREKGLVELMRAFAVLRSDDRLGDVRLVLVGAGPERARLETAARALGIARRVRFVEVVSYDDVPALHARASVFVLPSLPCPYWQEQFGMVLAEAMTAGKAIVATRSGSIPSVVGDAALLVPPYDPAALAEAIRSVLVDDDLRRSLEVRARARAQRFDAGRVAAELAATYRGLVTPGGRCAT
jgi:glycosyltransferase involved in cell wall biosynthesis